MWRRRWPRDLHDKLPLEKCPARPLLNLQGGLRGPALIRCDDAILKVHAVTNRKRGMRRSSNNNTIIKILGGPMNSYTKKEGSACGDGLRGLTA